MSYQRAFLRILNAVLRKPKFEVKKFDFLQKVYFRERGHHFYFLLCLVLLRTEEKF